MAISTKNKRKLKIGSRLFLWFVMEEPDYGDPVLRVISEDRQFSVAYALHQSSKPNIFVEGKEFGGVNDPPVMWRTYDCPTWEVNGVITPKSVRRLIDWCLDPDEEKVVG